MRSLILLVTTLYISIHDFRSHRIRNISLVILFVILLSDLNVSPAPKTIYALISSTLIAFLLRVGAGDLKLFLVLLFTQGGVLLTQQYLTLFMLSATALAALSIAITRGKVGSMAFGPVILLPFTALYLAI